jgi:hydrogenase maturation protease
MTSPLLVFGWGNRSRGDDALGPLLVERLAVLDWPAGAVEFVDDYQLQVEHALDLQGRRAVLFVDASVACAAPFAVTSPSATRDRSITTHALSAPALLQVYAEVYSQPPPPCTLLAIRGQCFDLGSAPTEAARGHLESAQRWAIGWIERRLVPARPSNQAPL